MKKTRYNYGTYGFWFNKLPMSARMKARRNFMRQKWTVFEPKLTANPLGSELKVVLAQSFNWATTPEGQSYWMGVHNGNS